MEPDPAACGRNIVEPEPVVRSPSLPAEYLPRRNSETSPPFLFARTTPPERRSPGAHAGPDHLQEDFAALASLRLRKRDPFRTHIPGRESASQRVKPDSGASPFGTPLLGPKSGPRMGARKQGAGKVHEGKPVPPWPNGRGRPMVSGLPAGQKSLRLCSHGEACARDPRTCSHKSMTMTHTLPRTHSLNHSHTQQTQRRHP